MKGSTTDNTMVSMSTPVTPNLSHLQKGWESESLKFGSDTLNSKAPQKTNKAKQKLCFRTGQ